MDKCDSIETKKDGNKEVINEKKLSDCANIPSNNDSVITDKPISEPDLKSNQNSNENVNDEAKRSQKKPLYHGLDTNDNDNSAENNQSHQDIEDSKRKKRKISDTEDIDKESGNVSENDESKTDLKVPPLKIVLTAQNATDSESSNGRATRNTNTRSAQNVPYVVISSTNDNCSEKDETNSLSVNQNLDEKKDKEKDKDLVNDEPRSSNQRVLRSSHKLTQNNNSNDITSNDGSQVSQQQQLPPPPLTSVTQQQKDQNSGDNEESCCKNTHETTTITIAISSETESDHSVCNETEPCTSSQSNSISASVELHPRKRKLKQSKEQVASCSHNFTQSSDSGLNDSIHPHEQPITNCYQLFLDIRKQIERRRKNLFPVQPKPPQGFKDYLMNRCTYVLEGSPSATPVINVPISVPATMKELYIDQEKERHKLRMQHVVEKEKLVLSVEQEILRVHGRAARALAGQSLPYSVCTILRDEEVYNFITPEQEEKDRNARSRYNGRLFLSWLQDVDDKWEKIKEGMLIRHHNEAESLFGVQKMDWEWKLKDTCDLNITPVFDESHVKRVHVSDDFDLLPT